MRRATDGGPLRGGRWPRAYFLLLTCYFLLLTSYFLLLTSYFLLLTSYFLLLTAYFLLPTSCVVAGGHAQLEMVVNLMILFAGVMVWLGLQTEACSSLVALCVLVDAVIRFPFCERKPPVTHYPHPHPYPHSHSHPHPHPRPTFASPYERDSPREIAQER